MLKHAKIECEMFPDDKVVPRTGGCARSQKQGTESFNEEIANYFSTYFLGELWISC